MTTTGTTRNQFIEIQNDFHRFLAQTKALAVVLMPEEEASTPCIEVVASAMWLLSDRLEDMEAAYNKTIEIVEGNSLVGSNNIRHPPKAD